MLSLIFTLVLPLLTVATSSNNHDARRPTHRRRGRSELSRLVHNIEPRGNRATYYNVGLGACGKTNKADESVIALNVEQFNNGEACSKMVQITYQGKSVQAQVVDECEECPWGGIDMSTSLFTSVAGSLGPGVLSVDWVFLDGSGGGAGDSNPKPKPKPKPTSSDPPPPPSTTTHKTHSSTASSLSSTSSSSSSSSTMSSSSTSSSTSSTPSSTPTTPPAPSNFSDLEKVIVALGQLVLAAE